MQIFRRVRPKRTSKAHEATIAKRREDARLALQSHRKLVREMHTKEMQERSADDDVERRVLAQKLEAAKTETRPPRAQHKRTPLANPSELMLKYRVSHKSVPDVQTLLEASRSTIFYGDRTGVSKWNIDSASEWSRRSRWVKLVDEFNDASVVEGAFGLKRIGSRDDPNVLYTKVKSGEYNTVFFPMRHCDARLPPVRRRDGSLVPHTDVVIRMTRSDDGSKSFRFKSLRNAIREIWHTMHAVAHDAAPSCYAAVVFPRLKKRTGGKDKLVFGTVFVLQRAACSLLDLLDAPLPMLSVDVQIVNTLKLLTLLSKTGVVNFDVKPDNLVFFESGRCYAIDFDATMYSLHPPKAAGCDDEHWRANLLVHVLLLMSHLRCFRRREVCEKWVAALRGTLIELVAATREVLWVSEARAHSSATFRPTSANDDVSNRVKFEDMAVLYFSNCRNDCVPTPFVPLVEKSSPALVHQLMRYTLLGSTDAVDKDIESCFTHVTDRGKM
jgi:hypothetical protein